MKGSVFKHVKRSSFYRVEGVASLQSAGPIEEGAQIVIYRAADGTLWARPFREFLDGRFERVECGRQMNPEEGSS